MLADNAELIVSTLFEVWPSMYVYEHDVFQKIFFKEYTNFSWVVEADSHTLVLFDDHISIKERKDQAKYYYGVSKKKITLCDRRRTRLEDMKFRAERYPKEEFFLTEDNEVGIYIDPGPGSNISKVPLNVRADWLIVAKRALDFTSSKQCRVKTGRGTTWLLRAKEKILAAAQKKGLAWENT